MPTTIFQSPSGQFDSLDCLTNNPKPRYSVIFVTIMEAKVHISEAGTSEYLGFLLKNGLLVNY